MRILVAIDFSAVTERMIDLVEHMPGRNDNDVFLLHVAVPEPEFVGYEAGPEVVRDQVAAELRHERDELHALAERLRRAGIDTTAIMVPGATVETIFEQVHKRSAELLVIGSHGHGAMFDLLFGSISEALVRRTTVPVLVVPARATGTP
jgi:nucleotide-binding universal stress UspA family protein